MSRNKTLDREAPVVRWKDDGDVEDGLERLIFAPFYERAIAASEMRALQAQAMAPIWSQIENHPPARDATRRLRDRINADVEASRPPHDVIRSSGTSWSFDIPLGTSFFTPPYDYARSGPSQGEGVTLSPDPSTGRVFVELVHDGDYDGVRGGSAAVGLGLAFSNNGSVGVRTALEYDISLWASGFILSSKIYGKTDIVVTDEDGTVVSNPPGASGTPDPSTWWAPTQPLGTSDNVSAIGVVGPPWTEVSFLAEAKRRYRLWYWVTMAGDQSGDHTFSGSWIVGQYAIDVKFVAVEIH
jgi:hypothetical protein